MDYSNAYIQKITSSTESTSPFCEFTSFDIRADNTASKVNGMSIAISMKPIQEIASVKKKNQVTSTLPLNIFSKPTCNSLFVQCHVWHREINEEMVSHDFKVFYYIEMSKSFPVNICFQLFNENWSAVLNSTIPLIDHNTFFKSKIPNIKSKQIEEFRQTQIFLTSLKPNSTILTDQHRFLLFLLFKSHFFILKISFMRKIIEGKELITDYSCSEIKSVCDCSFDGFILNSQTSDRLTISLISLDFKLVSFTYDIPSGSFVNENTIESSAPQLQSNIDLSMQVGSSSVGNTKLNCPSGGTTQIKLKKNRNCLVHYPFIGYAEESSIKKSESKKIEKVSAYQISCLNLNDLKISPYNNFANNFNENRIYRLFCLKSESKTSLFALSMTIAEAVSESSLSRFVIKVSDVTNTSNNLQIEMMINKELDVSFKTVEETNEFAVIAMNIERQGVYFFKFTGSSISSAKSNYFHDSFKSLGVSEVKCEDLSQSPIIIVNLVETIYVQAEVGKMCLGFNLNSNLESVVTLFNCISQNVEVLTLNLMQSKDALVLAKDTNLSDKFINSEVPNRFISNKQNLNENNLSLQKQNIADCTKDKSGGGGKETENFNTKLTLVDLSSQIKGSYYSMLGEFDGILNNRLCQMKVVLKDIEEDLESTRSKNNENLKNISKILSNLIEQAKVSNNIVTGTAALNGPGKTNLGFMPINSFNYNNHSLAINHVTDTKYAQDSLAMHFLNNQNTNPNVSNITNDILKRQVKLESEVKSSVASSSGYTKSHKFRPKNANLEDTMFSRSSSRTESENALEMSSFLQSKKAQPHAVQRKKECKSHITANQPKAQEKKGKKKKAKGKAS